MIIIEYSCCIFAATMVGGMMDYQLRIAYKNTRLEIGYADERK